jgi:hypothetical protein
MDGRHFIPTHRMSFKSRGIEISGYSVAQSDLPNYRIPRLLYTFFARRTGARRSLRPVVYEVVGDQVAGCAASPLGLAWQPTSTWTSDRPYLMRSDYLDTEWQSPAQAHLYLEIRPVVHDPQPDCTMLWRTHGRLADLGTRSISF